MEVDFLFYKELCFKLLGLCDFYCFVNIFKQNLLKSM